MSDPRSTNTGGHSTPGSVHPAPGGAGTGTPNSPEKEPAAQPNPKTEKK